MPRVGGFRPQPDAAWGGSDGSRGRSRWLIVTALVALILAWLPFDGRVLGFVQSTGLDEWISEREGLRWTLQVYARWYGTTALALYVLWRRRSLRTALAMGLICTLTGFCIGFVKMGVGRTRPGPAVRATGQYDGRFEGPMFGIQSSAYRAFPSGHTGNAVANTVMLARLLPGHPGLTAVAWTLTGIVGVERVVHAKHYPADVVGGVLFGWLFAIWLAGRRWLHRLAAALAWPFERALERLGWPVLVELGGRAAGQPGAETGSTPNPRGGEPRTGTAPVDAAPQRG